MKHICINLKAAFIYEIFFFDFRKKIFKNFENHSILKEINIKLFY